MPGFANYDTKTLRKVRKNLTAGLDKVAAHLDAGTAYDVRDKKGAIPPIEAGQLTLALLQQVDAELDERSKKSAAA